MSTNKQSDKVKWTKEKVQESAAKHTTKASWAQSTEQAAYQAARRYGNEFLESVCSHMEKPKRGRRVGSKKVVEQAPAQLIAETIS